jgi:hypothetical protein
MNQDVSSNLTGVGNLIIKTVAYQCMGKTNPGHNPPGNNPPVLTAELILPAKIPLPLKVRCENVANQATSIA